MGERRRREFLLAAGVLIAATLARGQTPRRIVLVTPFPESSVFPKRFGEGLAREGLIDGRDFVLDRVHVQSG